MMRQVLSFIAVALLAVSGVAADAVQSFNAGRAAFRAGELEKAQKHFEAAVKVQPNNAEYHFYLGATYGRQAAKANMLSAASLAGKTKTEFERAVELDPNHLEARGGLVDFYKMAPGFMGGSDQKALEQAREIKKRDAIRGAEALAKIHMHDKKPELAKSEMVAMVRAHPTSGDAHNRYGVFLYNIDKQKNVKAALDELESGVRIAPSHMPTWFSIGRISALSATNLARGEEALRKYLAYKPADDEPQHARTHYWLGVIHEKQGKKGDAKRAFQTSLQLAPKVKEVEEALKRVS